MNEIRRIALYCFYSSSGNAFKETLRQLEELKKCVDYLIVIVNGKINQLEYLTPANEIIIRENSGMDAGAYKTVISKEPYKALIRTYDELVLCNNTFFGPFCGFQKIFDDMEQKDIDFWGINKFNNRIMTHLQSFFLVYKKNILNDNGFYNFFEKNIDEKTNRFSSVCYWFENALFEYLIENNYSYGSYIDDLKYNIYEFPDKCIEKGLPILKKKVFLNAKNKDRVFLALEIIKKKYGYCIEEILNEIETEYNICFDINIKESVDVKYCIDAKEYAISVLGINDIINICKNLKNIYIYGVGNYAYYIYYKIKDNINIKGFIVSDDTQTNDKIFIDKPIVILNEVNDKKNSNVIIGFGKKNSEIVNGKLYEFNYVINIWEK